jgi:hypothetical protein
MTQVKEEKINPNFQAFSAKADYGQINKRPDASNQQSAMSNTK